MRTHKFNARRKVPDIIKEVRAVGNTRLSRREQNALALELLRHKSNCALLLNLFDDCSCGTWSTHKYLAQRTSCGLHQHPSKKEAIRCSALQALEKGKLIRDLSFQPRYDLIVNGILICRYVGDFKYREFRRDGFLTEIVEDSKGVRTPAYALKKKLMLALHGIDVRES